MDYDFNRTRGLEAERIFETILHNNKITFTKIDDWYDYEINNEKVDVKSTRISHKVTNKKRNNQSYSIGRFHFTEEQLEKELWVALFIRWYEQYIFCGFMKLKKNNNRYLSIHYLREENLLTLEEFNEQTRKTK